MSDEDKKPFIEFMKKGDSNKLGVLFHKVSINGSVKLPKNIIEIDINEVFENLKKNDPEMIKDLIGIKDLKI